MRRARLLHLATASCVGVVAATASPAGAAPDVWSFALEIAPTEDLSRMTVAMTFPDQVPKRLVLDDGAGAPWIGAAGADARDALVAHPAGGYAVAGFAPGGTFSYVVDLVRLQKKDGGAYRVRRDLVTRIGRWLLRPAALPQGSEATARFALPEGIHVATPWTPLEADSSGAGPYRVSPTTFHFWGWLALGRFEVDRFEAAGSTQAGPGMVEVARLNGELAATTAGIRTWLTTAVETVAALYGGAYPRRKLTAFVLPVPWLDGAGDAVSFAAAWPGGGGHLTLHLPSDTPDESLPHEWVAIHELVHLAMPVVAEEDAWLSEGTATYYQEVLRMRSGHFSERDGWQSLTDGFARGRRKPSGMTLLESSRTMRRTHAFQWTYWAGTAVMFRFDVALRMRSGGAVGLDDAMRRFARLVGSERPYGAEELSAEAQAVTGRPGLAALAAPALASAEFPDLAPTYAALGIGFEGGRVVLNDEAPAAAVRRAIATGMAGSKTFPAEPIPAGRAR